MSMNFKLTQFPFAVSAALLAALGLLAFYAMQETGDNNLPKPIANNVTSANSTTSVGKVDKLNSGKMSTFVFHREPKRLSDGAFNNSRGESLTIKSFAGKVVLLNLWATWCAPCRHEMPHLDRLQAELGAENFEVVAVSIDRGSPQKSRQFLDEIKAKALKLYHDPSAQMGFKMKAFGMPSTLLIDAAGSEIGRLVGPAEWDHVDAKRLIRAQLQKAN